MPRIGSRSRCRARTGRRPAAKTSPPASRHRRLDAAEQTRGRPRRGGRAAARGRFGGRPRSSPRAAGVFRSQAMTSPPFPEPTASALVSGRDEDRGQLEVVVADVVGCDLVEPDRALPVCARSTQERVGVERPPGVGPPFGRALCRRRGRGSSLPQKTSPSADARRGPAPPPPASPGRSSPLDCRELARRACPRLSRRAHRGFPWPRREADRAQ